MSPSNTREQSRPRARSRSKTNNNNNSSSSRRPLLATLFCLPRMPPVFNIVRLCVYVAVLLWTIVCLAIAAHFQSILQTSDLTRFVPFAIFVCCATLVIIVALLAFGLWKERNPISTRVELGCLGLAGTLWLALGAFVASSDSELADVECFSSSDADAEPIDIPGFNTETYHAQYHVLEAFSFFNMILIFAFLVLLLVLAIRQHRAGTKHVWILPVTMISWFGRTGRHVPKLPAPVTHRSRSRSRRPPVPEKEKPRARSQSRPAADVRRNESQRTLMRDDSYRTNDSRQPLNRDDSYRTNDSRRPLNRGDSNRTGDSRRPLNRDDSYRTTDSRRPLDRDDSYRTADSRGRSDLRRDDSRRTNDSSRRPDLRRDDSRRTNPGESRRARGASPTRNEAPTYVYWIPHKSPEEAHTRETSRARARDSKFFGLASRR
ncbi:hypothetical protein GSI_00876 [Ganoderma sinense ZZ0214-1]|uniref:MARVEL domain-containing protein n=1 Tax=Ganoderma sinense ZZ0214-1 TaxID=1077348 RepID=A0A2G8STV4_9APHY|nr:hypothetical protein GSI_00876 [Ganoderma sinense ZZ0214-1]